MYGVAVRIVSRNVLAPGGERPLGGRQLRAVAAFSKAVAYSAPAGRAHAGLVKGAGIAVR
jgi:hypothetical protein